ncbi:MAG: type II toxin-antitoxin system RelE/ParE family toxin [Phycisphaeraceae bacterium]
MVEIIWSVESSQNLESIHVYIAEENPRAAEATIRGLIDRVERLRHFPQLGPALQGYEGRHLRALNYGHYRIIYRLADPVLVELVGIYHAAMDLNLRLGG